MKTRHGNALRECIYLYMYTEIQVHKRTHNLSHGQFDIAAPVPVIWLGNCNLV